MLLIADSGSTKTDWRLVSDDGRTRTTIKTEGLNPHFLDEVKMSQIISEKVLSKIDDIEKVFFLWCGMWISYKGE